MSIKNILAATQINGIKNEVDNEYYINCLYFCSEAFLTNSKILTVVCLQASIDWKYSSCENIPVE